MSKFDARDGGPIVSRGNGAAAVCNWFFTTIM
jgi:hypothetical protein